MKADSPAKKNRLQEARHFARLYPDSEKLDWIGSLGHDQGRPLTRLQVALLIRVGDEKQRNKLAKKCAEESWSLRKLEREIARLGPRRKYGGRRQAPPKSRDEALVVTERLAGSLLRWFSVLISSESRAAHRRRVFEQLPRPVRERILGVSSEAELLCAAIEREFKGVRPAIEFNAGSDQLQH